MNKLTNKHLLYVKKCFLFKNLLIIFNKESLINLAHIEIKAFFFFKKKKKKKKIIHKRIFLLCTKVISNFKSRHTSYFLLLFIVTFLEGKKREEKKNLLKKTNSMPHKKWFRQSKAQRKKLSKPENEQRVRLEARNITDPQRRANQTFTKKLRVRNEARRQHVLSCRMPEESGFTGKIKMQKKKKEKKKIKLGNNLTNKSMLNSLWCLSSYKAIENNLRWAHSLSAGYYYYNYRKVCPITS